ncbi:MAG: adenylyltransferase/cytidyltransferase family protein, partial [Malacoplasma sp.]|nr:adenylyltransferase/cytidyltransferase family protein [Malacoplasma sp.]
MKKTNVKNIKKTTKQLPLAIGSFDIIHKGHWNLLKKVIGKEFNVLLIINSPKTNTYFNTTEQRINNIATLNPKNIYVFDVKKNNYSDQVFINKVLKHINPSQIIVGSNFKFGKNASGTIDKLIKKLNVLVNKF